jgi:hypothetical protein
MSAAVRSREWKLWREIGDAAMEIDVGSMMDGTDVAKSDVYSAT